MPKSKEWVSGKVRFGSTRVGGGQDRDNRTCQSKADQEQGSQGRTGQGGGKLKTYTVGERVKKGQARIGRVRVRIWPGQVKGQSMVRQGKGQSVEQSGMAGQQGIGLGSVRYAAIEFGQTGQSNVHVDVWHQRTTMFLLTDMYSVFIHCMFIHIFTDQSYRPWIFKDTCILQCLVPT